MTHLPLLRILASFCLFVFSSGIFADDSPCCPDRQAPTADLSTPENALKSYWAINAWEKDVIRAEGAKIRGVAWEAAAPHMVRVTTGRAKKYFEAFRRPVPEVFERTIKDISFETPDRSLILVTIKNVTPIPKDATPTPEEIEKRARGADFRYVLVREDTEWKISELWIVPTGRYPLPPRMMFEFLPSNYPWGVWYD